MREGAIRLNVQHRTQLSNDLGALAGLFLRLAGSLPGAAKGR